MGNSSSNTAESLSAASASPTNVDGSDLSVGNTTNPSDTQLNEVLQAVRDAFECSCTSAGVVDKTALLIMLQSKIVEEYPFLKAATAGVAKEANSMTTDDSDISPSPSCKKQKTAAEPQPQPTTTTTTTIYPRNSLQGQALEVIANISGCLDRTDYNNFALTCKRVHGVLFPFSSVVVKTPNQALRCLVEPPWPLSCPFKDFDDEFDVPPELLFSDDGSRLAVIREGFYADFSSHRHYPTMLEVWDRTMGFLGIVDMQSRFGSEPAFSPDAQLLLLSPRHTSLGIRVCQLPSLGQKVPIAVSFHQLSDAMFSCMTFIDNDTVCFVERGVVGVKICKINRENNQISFGEPEQVILGDPHPLPDQLRADPWGLLAYSKPGQVNGIIAFVYDYSDTSIYFYDRRRNVTVSRPIPSNLPNVLGLEFSQDGTQLVASHSHDISVFCCDVEKIEDIGQPTALGSNASRFSFYRPSTSPNYTKIAVSCHPLGSRRHYACQLHVIDIENGQTLSTGWSDSAWETLVSSSR